MESNCSKKWTRTNGVETQLYWGNEWVKIETIKNVNILHSTKTVRSLLGIFNNGCWTKQGAYMRIEIKNVLRSRGLCSFFDRWFFQRRFTRTSHTLLDETPGVYVPLLIAFICRLLFVLSPCLFFCFSVCDFWFLFRFSFFRTFCCQFVLMCFLSFSIRLTSFVVSIVCAFCCFS